MIIEYKNYKVDVVRDWDEGIYHGKIFLQGQMYDIEAPTLNQFTESLQDVIECLESDSTPLTNLPLLGPL